MITTKERKSFTWEVKALDDEQGLIEAYGSVFNIVDEGNDVVERGAFKRTIQNSKSRVEAGKAKYLAMMLWQHDTNTPIGGWTDMKEDEHGLLCKGQIILSIQQGREAYALIKEGVLNEFSIGYDLPNHSEACVSWDKGTGERHLKELRLWEISPVTFAMNDEALLVGVKKTRPPTSVEKKTFAEHYAEEMCEDLLEDWQDVLLSALTCAVLDAFKIGDQPASDISDAIDAFKGQVMTTFVAQGTAFGLSAYLAANAYSSADSTMQNGSGSSSYGGWMASRRRLSGKAGRAISASNTDKIQGHVDTMRKVAKTLKTHTVALNSAADDLATILQGSEAAYGTDPGTPAEGQQEGKAASPDEVRGPAQPHPSLKDTVDEQEELNAALAALTKIRALQVR